MNYDSNNYSQRLGDIAFIIQLESTLSPRAPSACMFLSIAFYPR